MSSPALLDDVTRRLRAAGCVAAEEEAAELVGSASDAATLERCVARRAGGEPLAWITGSVRFAGVGVRCAPGVYVPRAQTELLVDRAARALPAGGRALDLCTGTGAVAAALRSAVEGVAVVGVDLDALAITCARSNGVDALVADVGGSLPFGPRSFDVVTAVAPYVPSGQLRLLPVDTQRFEPVLALDGGDDGLDLVRGVVRHASVLLRRGGWLVLEVGGHQDEPLRVDLVAAGFAGIESIVDDDGDLRGMAARKAESAG